jgi:hypothetical protein
MAGKQILGDDPFAAGEEKETPPPLDVAPPVGKPKKEKAQ